MVSNFLYFCSRAHSFHLSDGLLLKFAQNLVLLGVGGHGLLPAITEVEAELRDQLYPAEGAFESEPAL